MIPLRLLWADLRRLWLPAVVLALLIASATALSMLVNLQERGLRLGSARAADQFDLVIGAPGSETQLVLTSVFLQTALLPLLPEEYIAEIADHPQVAWSAPLAFGDFYQGMPIIGTNQELLKQWSSEKQLEGQFFEQPFDAVVGKHSGLKIGDTIIPMHGEIGSEGGHVHDEYQYTVVGILAEQNNIWDKAIVVPLETVWQIHGIVADVHADEHTHAAGHGHTHADEHAHTVGHGHTHADEHAHTAGHGHTHRDEHDHDHSNAFTQTHSHDHADEHHVKAGVSAILVKPKSIASAYQLRSEYRTDQTMAVFPAEILTKLYTILGDIRQLLALIAVGTQVLLGVCIVIVAMIYVNQRKRQIAALRAFGASRYAIFTLVWLGLMIMVLLGVGFGIGMGYTVAQLIASQIAEKSGFSLPIELTWTEWQNIVILMVVATIAAFIPALMTYRHSPRDALRDH